MLYLRCPFLLQVIFAPRQEGLFAAQLELVATAVSDARHVIHTTHVNMQGVAESPNVQVCNSMVVSANIQNWDSTIVPK